MTNCDIEHKKTYRLRRRNIFPQESKTWIYSSIPINIVTIDKGRKSPSTFGETVRTRFISTRFSTNTGSADRNNEFTETIMTAMFHWERSSTPVVICVPYNFALLKFYLSLSLLWILSLWVIFGLKFVFNVRYIKRRFVFVFVKF